MKATTISLLFISALTVGSQCFAQVVGNCVKNEVSGETVCVDPPPSCEYNLQYYVELAEDESNILTRALRALIKEIAANGQGCSVQLQEIETQMNTFWASDPYCRLERKDLKRRIEDEAVDSRIPRFAIRTITDALDQEPLSCRVGLNAAQAILGLYLPDLFSGVAPLVDVTANGTPTSNDLIKPISNANKSRKPKRNSRRCHCRRQAKNHSQK